MITITAKAVEQIKELSEAEGIGYNIVRIGVKGGGCAGYMTDMAFDDQIQDTDEVIEQNDVKIVIDMISFQYLDGTEIDYVEGLTGAGFKFNNPQAQHTCGCGKSWA
jgi:iron-sulfur cluster insertion protein